MIFHFGEAKNQTKSKERSTNVPDWVKHGGFRPDPNEKWSKVC